MDIKRRTFIQAASVGAAGLIVPQVFGHTLADPAGDAATGTTGHQSGLLDLRIWGSCLYVFTKDRKRLELAFFGASTASSCHTLAHQPQLLVGHGRVKHVDGLAIDKTSAIWRLPPGEITIATASQEVTPPLSTMLKEGVTPCPPKPDASKDFFYPLENLAYVPPLRAKGGLLKGWRKRATTRIVLTSGTLTAAAPHIAPGDIAEMDLVGAGQPTTQVVTDTTRYTLPLAGRNITFSWSNEKGDKGSVTYEPIGKAPLRLVIKAGPESTGKEPALKEGDSLPHWCALYSVFEKMPEERAELRVKRFCLHEKERTEIRTARAARMSRSARSVDEREAIKAQVNGPTPGDLCPGAIIVLDGETD